VSQDLSACRGGVGSKGGMRERRGGGKRAEESLSVVVVEEGPLTSWLLQLSGDVRYWWGG